MFQRAKKRLCMSFLCGIFGVALAVQASCSGNQSFSANVQQESKTSSNPSETHEVAKGSLNEPDAQQKPHEQVDPEDLSVAIGTEIHGINLTGQITVNDEAVAQALVKVTDTSCETKTDDQGLFSLFCAFSYVPEKSTITVYTSRGGEALTLTLPAINFVKPEAKIGQTDSVPQTVTNVPLLRFTSNPVTSMLESGFWGPGVDRIFGRSSLFQGQHALAMTSTLGFSSFVHDAAFATETETAMYSNCGNLIDTLQSVSSSSPVTLSYTAGLGNSGLVLHSGSVLKKVNPSAQSVALSWICGAAFDSKRKIFWSGSFGGTGYLLAVDPQTAVATPVAEKVGFTNIAYVSGRDELFALDTVQNLQEIQSMQILNIAASSAESVSTTLRQRTDLSTFSVLLGLPPEGASALPSVQSTTVKLSKSIPMCFRNSLVQLRGGADSAFVHVFDNVNRLTTIGSNKPSPQSTRYPAFQRIYRIQENGAVSQVFSTVSGAAQTLTFQNLLQFATPAQVQPEVLCNASY